MKITNRFRTLSCCLLWTIAAALSAQSWTPQKIVFNGTAGYTPAELTKATGLTAGTSMSKAEIEQAMQKLADTGLFADMRYNVDDHALSFSLTAQPDTLMLPASYTNFVMFEPGELTPLVHARVPLFHGKVPNVGNLQQAVQDALTAILADKGIKARVDVVDAAGSGGSVTALNFSIGDPPVEIRNLQVDGVSSIAQAKVAEIRKEYMPSEFDLQSGPSIQQRLADAYRDFGLLDVAIDPPTHAAPAIEPTTIWVDLSTTVHEGSIYRVSKLTPPTSDLVPHGAFEKAAQLKAGEPASRLLLLATKAKFQQEFSNLGYLEAQVSVDEQKDSAAHTIAYDFAAVPGPQYHLKRVMTVGLNDQQQKEFDKTWKMMPGAVFDERYVQRFVVDMIGQGPLRGYKPTSKMMLDRGDHTVVLELQFSQGMTR